jgi:hypothetical protein
MDMGLEGWNQGDARVTRPLGGFICNVNVDIDPGPLTWEQRGSEDDFDPDAHKRVQARVMGIFLLSRKEAVEMDGDDR